MCYNISRNTYEEKLIKRFNKGLQTKLEFPPQVYINGFGHPKIPIIKQEEKDSIGAAFWGFVPSHIKNEKDAKEFRMKYLTLNAKSETVFKLTTFKSSILPRRCLIPVTGVFEHRHIDPAGKNKIPYYIKLQQEEIFCLAGIYGTWTNEFGETKTTCSVLTTEANPLMEKIHNSKKRMPLILGKDQEEIWLDQGLVEKDVVDLMQIFDEKLMYAHPISKISPKTTDFSSESMLEKVEYAEITDL